MGNTPNRSLSSGAWRLGAGTLTLLVAACGGGGGSSTPPPQTAPAITTQPQSQTVTAPTTATFTVACTGNPTPTYQWNLGGTAISGATAAAYTTPATTVAMSGGSYTATVTNSMGTATSSAATLTVNAPTPVAPTITTQPQSQTVTAPAPATFSVTATGVPAPTYQWYLGGATITGATSTSYTTPATTVAMSGGSYTVTVTNSAGNIHSDPATLTVNTTPAPGAPSGVTATPGNLAVALTWNTVSSATGYNVYRGTASGALATKTKLNASPVTSPSYQDQAVVNGNLYYYQITSVGTGGESAGSTEVSAPVINLTGTAWTMQETVLTNSCGTDIGTVTTRTATITQAAGTNTFSGTLTGGGTFTGTISGQTVTINGSEPYTAKGYNGTLNFQGTTTWAKTATTITLTGTGPWQFIYSGTTYCTGTMSFNGSMN